VFCPKCNAEYREGFTKCYDCQIDLVNEIPKEPEDEIDPDISFIEVLRTDNIGDIAFIRGILDSEGFHYYLKGENMKFIRPVDPVILMVLKEEAHQAAELLKALDFKYSAFTFDV